MCPHATVYAVQNQICQSEVEEIASVNSVQAIESCYCKLCAGDRIMEYLAGTLLSVLCSCHRFSFLFSGGLESFARYRRVLRR